MTLLARPQSAGLQARAFILGVLCAIAQLILFRELMGTLYGNELVFLGLIAGWSVGIAAGSSWCIPRWNSEVLFVLALVLLVAVVFCIRHLRSWQGWPPGQIGSFGTMLLVSFLLTLPVSVVCGALYAVLARNNGALVYGVESLGFAAGGLLTWVFLLSPLNTITPEARSAQWPGYKVIGAQETSYASLVVAKRGGENSLFENGIHVATTMDRLTSEEIVHYALLAQRDPKKMLLIGALATGAVNEALQHPGLAVDCVERDAKEVDLILANFPVAVRAVSDPRVRLLLGDGRSVVRRAGQSYDVIIISAGDPVSLLSNRFYTAEFFRDARGALKSGGILAISMLASHNYVNAEGRFALSVLRATLGSIFDAVTVIPGERYLFLAAQGKNNIQLNAEVLASRFHSRGLQTQYVRPYDMALRLESDRLDQAADVSGGPAIINTDLRPIGFLAFLAYVATQTRSSFTFLLDGIRQYSWVLWLLPAGIFLAARVRAGVPFISVCAAGFSQISLQIGVIMLFQVLYGYIYSALGVITALFMLGIFCGTRSLPADLYKVQLAAAGLMVLSALSIVAAASFGGVAAGFFFVLIPFLTGWSAGAQFTAGLALVPGKAGVLYSLDVAGTAVGALLCGVFLIPLWGIPAVLIFCAMIQLAIALSGICVNRPGRLICGKIKLL